MNVTSRSGLWGSFGSGQAGLSGRGLLDLYQSQIGNYSGPCNPNGAYIAVSVYIGSTMHDYTYGLLLYGDIVNAFAFALYTLHYRPQATKFNLMVVGYRACRELTTCSSTALKPSKLTLTMVRTTAAQLSSSREGLRV